MSHSIQTQQVTPETLPAMTWEKARVVTTDLLAKLYGADSKRIHDNFQNNQLRFVAGKHYFRLEKSDLKSFKNYPEINGLVQKHARQIILWTERGAARHAKMLDTDAAWEVFEKLEDCYFAVRDCIDGHSAKQIESKYNFPVEMLMQPYFCGVDKAGKMGLPKLDLRTFADANFDSPMAALLKRLHDDGHNVDAPFAEFAAIQEGLRRLNEQLNAIASIGTSAGNSVLKMMNRKI